MMRLCFRIFRENIWNCRISSWDARGESVVRRKVYRGQMTTDKEIDKRKKHV